MLQLKVLLNWPFKASEVTIGAKSLIENRAPNAIKAIVFISNSSQFFLTRNKF